MNYIRNQVNKLYDALHYRRMTEADIDTLVPLYMDYYNTYEEGQWRRETTYKRIHQVWSHEDALCLILCHRETAIGFAMGHMEQYDDLVAYDLIEIVISHEWQNRGIGTWFMSKLETEAKASGAAMIQLEAVNDERHERFYSNLEYQTCTNLILKSKFL